MVHFLKEFLDEDILKDIMLAIIFFISSIIFALNEDNMGKEYQKKYIIILYLIYFAFFMLTGANPETIDNLIFTFLLVTLLVNLICGINYGYKSDNLSKFLGRGRLVLFKSLEWFFITKSYIFYIFIFSLKLTSYIFIRLNIAVDIAYYIIFSIFFIYHLLSNMIDTFGVYSFIYLSNSFFKAKDSFENFELNKNEEVDLVSILGFLVFVEDRDYFERKGAVFNPFYVIKRKMDNLKIDYVKKENKVEGKLIGIIKHYIDLAKHSIKLTLKILCNIKVYTRGFSTIEQQLVRVLIMYPDTFEKYVFRRKIFVEWIVNPMFFKAFKERRKVVRGVKKINYNQLKVEFLLFYYVEILGMPKSIDELINKLYSSSRLSRENLEDLLGKYNSSSLKVTYNNILTKELKMLKVNI